MNANYRKGRRNEYRAMRLLESAGYKCIRSAGSHSPWDVVGVGKAGVVLVQCKSNGWPTPAEQEVLSDYAVPPHTLKLVYRWDDRRKEPLVREVP